MNFLHYEYHGNQGDVIEVTLDRAANVQLLNSANFMNYKNGRKYRYWGGHIKESPCRLVIPQPGQWHLVIDLGGAAGAVRASARLIPAPTGAVS